MAQQTFDTLHRALKKGELAPVYYLYGPEDILKEQSVQSILAQALDPATRDFNFDQLSASQADPESLHVMLNTLPMMAERRVVVLRDVEALKRKVKVKAVLDGYLARPASDTLLVLVQGSGETKADPALAKGSAAIEFTPLAPDRALRWIQHYAAQHQLELASDAATHLFESVGNDLGMLRMELDKIASLEIDGPVSADVVAGLVGVRRGETLLSWRDLVLEGRIAPALSMVGSVLEQTGMSGVKMASSVGTALVGLQLARIQYDSGLRDRSLQQKLLSTLFAVRPFGLGDWRVESEKWARWSPAWPASRIRVALKATLLADFALKNTRISDERGVITDLVLQVTEHRWGEAA